MILKWHGSPDPWNRLRNAHTGRETRATLVAAVCRAKPFCGHADWKVRTTIRSHQPPSRTSGGREIQPRAEASSPVAVSPDSSLEPFLGGPSSAEAGSVRAKTWVATKRHENEGRGVAVRGPTSLRPGYGSARQFSAAAPKLEERRRLGPRFQCFLLADHAHANSLV